MVLNGLFDSTEMIQHFKKRGFAFENPTENCTGYLYHKFDLFEHEILTITGIAHQILFRTYPFNLQASFYHMKGTSIFNFKLEAGDINKIWFSYNPIKFSLLKELYNKTESITKANDDDNSIQIKYKNNSVTLTFLKKEKRDTNIRRNMNVIFNLTGNGLHRHLEKTIFSDEVNKTLIKFKPEYEQNCDIVLFDIVSEETYVDQDEIIKVPYIVTCNDHSLLIRK
jgi:hypothetical protein